MGALDGEGIQDVDDVMSHARDGEVRVGPGIGRAVATLVHGDDGTVTQSADDRVPEAALLGESVQEDDGSAPHGQISHDSGLEPDAVGGGDRLGAGDGVHDVTLVRPGPPPGTVGRVAHHGSVQPP